MNAPLPEHLLPEIRQRETPTALLDALKARFAERCSTALVVREQHGRDESSFAAPPPAAVVFAESTQDVADVVKLAGQYKVPVIPFGVGTSLEGHLLAVQGGISIDVSRMNQVLSINAEDLTVTVQPGVTRKQLNEYLRDTGLFFPIDPGADASLGGMAATRASGTNAVRYGTMRENVLTLTVVLADGRIIRTARRARKSAAGYDLTRLFVGSEGTLGVVTEVHWKLDPIPPHTAGAALGFADLESMTEAVPYLGSLRPSAIELLDETLLRFVPEAPKVACLLLVEFEREDAAAARGVVGDAVRGLKASAVHVETAVNRAGLEHLWSVRRLASPALARLPATQRSLQIVEDGCVPLDALGAYVAGLREAARRHTIPVAIFGHAGDGHVHVNALPDTTRDGWREALAALFEDVTALLLRLGGVPSGEHGVGRLRAGVLERFYGKAIVELFREVKRAYDPLFIFNPGVIIPATDRSPVAALKVGAGAAVIPDDIATRLRDVERNAAWATPKLELTR